MNNDYVLSIATASLVVLGLVSKWIKNLYSEIKQLKREETEKDFSAKLKQDSAESTHWHDQFIKWSDEIKIEVAHYKKEHLTCTENFLKVSSKLDGALLRIAELEHLLGKV